MPTDPEWEKVPAGLREFYEDPEAHPLATPSGKLEFYSQRLADHYPDDTERGPLPKWIESSVTHDERIGGERAQSYPLLLVTNHGRWRTHAQNDDISWQREIRTCKIKGWDGYLYEPVWINPVDAEARGIKDGDIVKMFNERGTVLGAAYVWERIMPGAVCMDHGARVDLLHVGDDVMIDRGGANNLISPLNGISQNCWGMATSGFLVDVQKVTMAEMGEWREKYPEAFARAYDPAAGLRFDAWVIPGRRLAMSKVFVFDTSICNGCYCCQIACKDEHCGNDWTPYAKPQPETGQFWLKLHEYVRGTVPKVKMHYLPTLCNHCDDGACVQACKVEGAIYKREDGLVVIDPEKCTGCMSCADVCPSHAIFFNEDLNLAQKCTGCAHLLDSGEWTEPRCVDACPTGALRFLEEDEAQGADRRGRASPPRRAEAAGLLPERPQEVHRRYDV